VAVDWTALGAFRALEACLIVEGRGIPFYSLLVHKDELKHRQTLVELTMWYALIAMRQPGQTLLVAVDRGFTKFDWVGASPLYPFMHLLLRLKRTTLLNLLYAPSLRHVTSCRINRSQGTHLKRDVLCW
jgi:hypothetical protein